MSDRVEGAIVAPETPSRALEMMSISAFVKKAANTDVRAKVMHLLRAGGADQSCHLDFLV
jgi:hypothetical protein